MTNLESLKRQFHECNAISEGDFTLSSGIKSKHYVDVKKVLLTSLGAYYACVGINALVSKIRFDTIGCMELGGVPLLSGMLAMPATDRIFNGFIVRKEAKGHGRFSNVEGTIREGAEVLVVEDVTTTGASALQVVDAAVDAGARVIGVATVVDREYGAAELFKEAGIPFFSLLTASDLGLKEENHAG